MLLSKSSVVLSHRGFESRPLRRRATSMQPVSWKGRIVGLVRAPGKRVSGKTDRGFESRPFRRHRAPAGIFQRGLVCYEKLMWSAWNLPFLFTVWPAQDRPLPRLVAWGRTCVVTRQSAPTRAACQGCRSMSGHTVGSRFQAVAMRSTSERVGIDDCAPCRVTERALASTP